MCGLTVEETDKLQLDTGERLGQLFSCDGNCANKFHTACVGIIGEGGQYCTPDGEWFCLQCSNEVNSPTLLGKEAFLNNSSNNNNNDNTETDINPLELSQPNREISALAGLRYEYNLMRKERNRVFQSWQQDKKLFLALEESWKKGQQKQDLALVNLRQKFDSALSEIEEKRLENHRLQRIYEEAVVQFQQKQDLDMHRKSVSSSWRSVDLDFNTNNNNNNNSNKNSKSRYNESNRVEDAEQEQSQSELTNIPKPWKKHSSEPNLNINNNKNNNNNNYNELQLPPMEQSHHSPLPAISNDEETIIPSATLTVSPGKISLTKRTVKPQLQLANSDPNPSEDTSDRSKFINPLKVGWFSYYYHYLDIV